MKRMLGLAALALAVGLCGWLRADDAPPSPAAPTGNDSFQSADAYLWYVEHSTAIAKDPETSAVEAMLKAHEILKAKEPQVEIDFFTKALYDAKSRTVQRAVRMELYELYKNQGHEDKALDQLQQLMIDQ